MTHIITGKTNSLLAAAGGARTQMFFVVNSEHGLTLAAVRGVLDTAVLGPHSPRG